MRSKQDRGTSESSLPVLIYPRFPLIISEARYILSLINKSAIVNPDPPRAHHKTGLSKSQAMKTTRYRERLPQNPWRNP